MGRGRDEWLQLVDEYERSGETQAEFASRLGCSVSTLQFWIYKLRRERQVSPRILPVRVVASPAPVARDEGQQLQVVLPNGASLRFPVGTDPGYLRELLEALG